MVLMFNSLFTEEDITMVHPWSRLGIATPIVAMKTNRISWIVVRKTVGRAFGFGGGLVCVRLISFEKCTSALSVLWCTDSAVSSCELMIVGNCGVRILDGRMSIVVKLEFLERRYSGRGVVQQRWVR